MAGAAQERKAQRKSLEATYVKPSACFGTAVLRTKNIVPGKIIPQPPTVSPVRQIYLISRHCLWGCNFCFLSSHSYLLSHAWPERNKVQVRTWGQIWAWLEWLVGKKKGEAFCFAFAKALAPFWLCQSLLMALQQPHRAGRRGVPSPKQIGMQPCCWFKCASTSWAHCSEMQPADTSLHSCLNKVSLQIL